MKPVQMLRHRARGLLLLGALLLTPARSSLSPAQAPSLSPTPRGRIAFVDAGNLFVIHADGSGKKQLTTSGTDRSPAWSRDGRKLAFIRGSKAPLAPSD